MLHLAAKQKTEPSLSAEHLCRPKNDAKYRNIKVAGQNLQPMIALPGRYDPPEIHFIEPKEMLCAVTQTMFTGQVSIV
jgi:hypothetical protein